MIEKIIAIQDVGRFDSLKSVGDATFRKLTLVFGRNGEGKSTVADVLRAAASHGRLLSRRRLGSGGTPKIELRHAGVILRKTNGTWSGTRLLADVFDREFIDRNVHLGGEVAAEQRQNLLQLALGEAEVAAAREVDELATKITDVTTKRGGLVKQLEPVAGAWSLSVDEFLALPAPIEPSKTHAELDHAIGNAKMAQPIRDRPLLSPLPGPQASDWTALEAVLGVSVETVSEAARASVTAHLAVRLGDERARTWVQEGLRYQRGAADCPYCGQDVSRSDLVAAYSKYFSDAYEKHLAKLRGAMDLAASRAHAWQSIELIASNNEKSSDFWNAVLGEQTPEFNATAVGLKWSAALAIAERLLAAKLADPMTPIAATEAIAAAERDTVEVLDAVKLHNDAVGLYNAKLMKLKASVGVATVAELTARKKRLSAAMQRHDSKCAPIAGEINARDAEKRLLEKAKAEARKRLDAARTQRLSGFETDVNQLLGRLGAGFRIESFRSVLPGGKPSAEYGIRLGDSLVSATARRDDAPSFRTLLSDGDKSTLALAMFVASARRAPDQSQRTLIFDDPMTSLDEDRTHSTKELIVELVGSAGQVVVLSHQPRFLLEIGRGLAAGDVRGLKIDAIQQALKECDLRTECRSDYERRMSELREFARQRVNLTENDVRASIRVVLEEYLRTRFPHMWGDNAWLDDFVQAAQKDAQLPGVLDLVELVNLSRFSSPAHHASNSVRFLPATPTEVRNYASRTYAFIANALPA